MLELFISIFFFIWWLSLSSSLSLLVLVVLTVVFCMYLKFFMWGGLAPFLLVLAIGGGLFVLFGFVILSLPPDYKKGAIDPVNLKGMIIFPLTFWIFKSINFVEGESEVMDGKSVFLFEAFSLVFLFSILLLFFSLFSMNYFLEGHNGGIFSQKKTF